MLQITDKKFVQMNKVEQNKKRFLRNNLLLILWFLNISYGYTQNNVNLTHEQWLEDL